MTMTMKLANEQDLLGCGRNASENGRGMQLRGDRPLDFCMGLTLAARYCFFTNRFDQGACLTNCERFSKLFSLFLFSDAVTDSRDELGSRMWSAPNRHSVSDPG